MEVPVALSVFVCLALVCLSALFSGLTLGLLSLDTVGLQVTGRLVLRAPRVHIGGPTSCRVEPAFCCLAASADPR